MEGGFLKILFSAENVRTTILLVAMFSGFMWMKNSLSKEMDEKMDKRFEAFHAQLKTNDFKHLNDAIEALTYALEKNNYLSPEDKKYIDGRLDK
jgi:hypothetical protein